MILEQLSNASGVSGNEQEVREIIYSTLRGHVDSLSVDTMGNLFAKKNARSTSKTPLRIMVAAHMDEVGLMIIRYEANGCLRFSLVGGIDDRILAGKTVLIGPEKIPGVIGLKPIHLLEGDEYSKVCKHDSLVIDFGATSREEAEKCIPLGTYAHFNTRYSSLDSVAIGKALDDRVGCAVLIDLLMQEPSDCEIHGVFTVQEEVGLRGSQIASFCIDPDCAIILESTICDDLPKEKDTNSVTVLGKGPAFTVMDRSVISHRGLLRHFIAVAEELRIPYQFKQPGIGSTDAGSIARSKSGVPSVVIAAPCRYIHSPVCMVSHEDIRTMTLLLREGLNRLTVDSITYPVNTNHCHIPQSPN